MTLFVFYFVVLIRIVAINAIVPVNALVINILIVIIRLFLTDTYLLHCLSHLADYFT